MPVLVQTATYEDEAVRHNIARALGDIRPPAEQAVPALVMLLRDKSSKVRCKAAESLGKLGPDAKDAIVPLIEALDDHDKVTRHFASMSLLRMGHIAIPHLVRYLEDEKHVMRSWACDALAGHGAAAEEALPALRRAAQDKDRTVRDAAAAAVRQIEAHLKLKTGDSASPPR